MHLENPAERPLSSRRNNVVNVNQVNGLAVGGGGVTEEGLENKMRAQK
jgi:hypothetical protein